MDQGLHIECIHLLLQVETEDGAAAVGVAKRLTLQEINDELIRLEMQPADSLQMLTTNQIINQDGSAKTAFAPAPFPNSGPNTSQGSTPPGESVPSSEFPLVPVVAGACGGCALCICLCGVGCWWQRRGQETRKDVVGWTQHGTLRAPGSPVEAVTGGAVTGGILHRPWGPRMTRTQESQMTSVRDSEPEIEVLV